MTAGAGWDELIDRQFSTPVWSGIVRVVREVPQVWCWWQVWDTARFDLGFTARVPTSKAPGAVEAAVVMVDDLCSGLAGTLVVPALAGVPSWTVERRPVSIEEMERRYGGSGRGTEVTSVRAKVTVKVADGKMLEGVMTAMNKFALEMGWDGTKLK